MKIIFKYDLDRDVENFISSTKSINSKKPTQFFLLYKSLYEEVKEENVKKFIESQSKDINLSKKEEELNSRWLEIQLEAIQRLEKMFNLQYPASEIIAYLTFNERCTYNVSKNYFFVNLNNVQSNRTVLHELFHFYTWHSVRKDLLNRGISEEKYNDIKESLTVILNLEFSDLLSGAVDMGYPQHQEMRNKIKELWNNEKNIHKLVLDL